MSGSVRDNVLFGSDANEERLKKIYNICNLDPDITRMKQGDLYEVGEHGPSFFHSLLFFRYSLLSCFFLGAHLSGGQKQRVSLARYRFSTMFCV